MGNYKLALILIFILALFLRFLYFPKNIYFGYDQARDAFAATDILKGDLKIIGPSTSVEGLYHGAIYYYLITPLYLFGSGSPEFVAAFLRILNALGVFLVFAIGTVLFSATVGLLAALLFAISFEQTQFSIYLSNPAPASLTIPLMFFGLASVIYAKKYRGLILSFLGLGLSIQFEFALLYLVIPFFIILLTYHKSFLKTPLKYWAYSIAAGLLSISTLILAELKYSFRTVTTLLTYSNPETKIGLVDKFKSYLTTLNKMGEFNLYDGFGFGMFIWLVLLLLFLYLFKDRKLRSKLFFLGIWFFSLLFVYLLKGGYSDLYYTNIGISVGLLIFLGLILSLFFKKSLTLGVFIIILIMVSNLNLITNLNQKGTISQIHVQQGMLLSDEKQIIDQIYADSNGLPFTVKALTMPYKINTTWSYLFEWYGNQKYGYLPIWSGDSALGFPGRLKIETKQELLPEKRYLIIEPIRGIPGHLIEEYIREEGYFTNIVKEENIGKFTLQTRVKK